MIRCNLQTLTINGNPRLAYVHSGAITDVPRLAALDLSRNALFALESALPARFPARTKKSNSQCHCQSIIPLTGEFPSQPNPIFQMLSCRNLTNEPALQALKALYLSGNSFHCHCGLRWISDSRFPGGAVLQDRDRIMCHPGGQASSD